MRRSIANFGLIIVLIIYALTSCEKETAKPVNLTDILVNVQPSKINYKVGEYLDLSGLGVKLKWDNGEIDYVSFLDFADHGITCSPNQGELLIATSTTITISHNPSGKKTSLAVIISDVIAVSIKTPPSKEEYSVNEVLDLSGLVVELKWGDDTNEEVAFSDFVAKGISCSPMNGDALTLLSDEVVITHIETNNKTSQNINVYGSVEDVENNIYKTVQIGSQIWMAENLKTTYYNDGSPITLATNEVWANGEPAYCWYKNDAVTYKEEYGGIYNWFAINPTSNGGENICPSGWHVPTDTEWKTLIDYLGGDEIAGDKMKEKGNLHWNYPNVTASNSSGFSALPGGSRSNGTTFWDIGIDGKFWTSSEVNSTTAVFYSLNYIASDIYRKTANKEYGYSVRCLKD